MWPKRWLRLAQTTENQHSYHMPNRSNPADFNEVVHPGVILRQVLDERSIKQKDLSDAIGKSTPVVNDILQSRRGISPEIAYMLEAVIEDIPAE